MKFLLQMGSSHGKFMNPRVEDRRSRIFMAQTLTSRRIDLGHFDLEQYWMQINEKQSIVLNIGNDLD